SSCAATRPARPAARGSSPRTSSSSTTRSSATSVFKNRAGSSFADTFAFAGGAGTAPPSTDRDFPLGLEGVRYADLHDPASLAALAARFRAALAAQDPPLAERFEAYRAGAELRPPDESELLIAVARPLSEFVARLFRVESGRQALIDFASREQAV